jgi:hypothetical protein
MKGSRSALVFNPSFFIILTTGFSGQQESGYGIQNHFVQGSGESTSVTALF